MTNHNIPCIICNVLVSNIFLQLVSQTGLNNMGGNIAKLNNLSIRNITWSEMLEWNCPGTVGDWRYIKTYKLSVFHDQLLSQDLVKTAHELNHGKKNMQQETTSFSF